MTIVARFVRELDFEALPKKAVATASQLAADTVAVGWAGSDAPGIDALRAMALTQGGRQESTLWGSGEKLPASEATFVNAAAAAALDYDTVHAGSIMHAEAVVLPAVLALAQARGISGRDALVAYIAGVEIAHRMSMATPRRSGWFHSSAVGIFGAAAACARLIGLDAERIDDALGIALSMSGGTKQAIVERTLTKRLQTAFAARNGLQAALLAECGTTGPSGWLDGTYGWMAQYEAGDLAAFERGLGRDFAFMATGVKKYPCCLCSHASLDAAFGLMRDENIAASDVSAVHVTISPYMSRIVGALFEPGSDPQVAAQFSVQYVVACAVFLGRFTLAEIEPEFVAAAASIARTRQVTVGIDESWTGHLVPTTVAVRVKSGREFIRRFDKVPGSPDSPLSASDLSAKFADCVGRGSHPLAKGEAAAFEARINGLADLPQIDALWPPAARRSAA